jgi:hypothetical protein
LKEEQLKQSLSLDTLFTEKSTQEQALNILNHKNHQLKEDNSNQRKTINQLTRENSVQNQTIAQLTKENHLRSEVQQLQNNTSKVINTHDSLSIQNQK